MLFVGAVCCGVCMFVWDDFVFACCWVCLNLLVYVLCMYVSVLFGVCYVVWCVWFGLVVCVRCVF